MINGAEYTRKYSVVFRRSGLKRFYMKWLDKEFGHVSILRKDDFGRQWLYADNMGGNLWIDVFPLMDLREVFKGASILDVWSVPIEKPSCKIAHINCVEMAKLVLGIQNFWIWTPYQLYKYLTSEKQTTHRALKHEGIQGE